MRAALVALLAASPAAADPPAGGGYGDTVRSTQPAQGGETRTELACSARFVATSKRPRSEPPPSTACTQKDFDARMTCLDEREKRLAALPAAELWKEPDTDLVYHVSLRIDAAATAGAKLTPEERELVAVYVMFGEVSNGGLHQYFFNSSGDAARDARAGLAHAGMTDSLAIFDCALTAFPAGTPDPDRRKRNAQLARWGDRQFTIFDVLTSAWYRVLGGEEPRLAKLVRANREKYPSANTPIKKP